MMTSTIFANGFRFGFLVLFQVIILRGFALEWANTPYTQILIYPLFIMLLPLRTRRWAQLLLAFALGMSVDLFYDSPGVHAAAAVFTAYCRPYVLDLLEPRGGYNVSFSPTKEKMGLNWFLRYTSILLLLHCLFYFSVETFSFAYFTDILLKTFFCFIFSMVVLLIVTFIFNPKE